MPIVGLLWGLTVFQVNRAEISAELDSVQLSSLQALLFVVVGGLAQTLAFWLGFTGVCWAMIRAFGARIPLLRLSTMISAASLPLWVGAPAAAYWHYTSSQETLFALLSIISFGLFLYLVAKLISSELHWSILRALGATLATVVFLVSFITLSL